MPSRRREFGIYIVLRVTVATDTAPVSKVHRGNYIRYTDRPVDVATATAGDASVLSGQISRSQGLVSIDRSEVAALLRTTPRPNPSRLQMI